MVRDAGTTGRKKRIRREYEREEPRGCATKKGREREWKAIRIGGRKRG